VNARIQTFGGFRVDVALSHDASERFLNVRGRAIEAIIKVEVAERGVEIIAPQQAYHTSP